MGQVALLRKGYLSKLCPASHSPALSGSVRTDPQTLPTFCLKRLSSPGHTYLQRRQHTGTGELGLGLKRPHSTGVSDRGGIVEG